MLSTYRARHNHRYYPDIRHDHRKRGLIRCSSFAVSPGHACHKQATMPHMTGEEKEVPLALPWFPSVRITSAPSPTATTSGLIRLSAVLPMEENGASNACLFDSSHRQHILGISRRGYFLPGTHSRITGTAHQHHTLIGYTRCLTGHQGSNVRPNRDICNSSICHRKSNIPTKY